MSTASRTGDDDDDHRASSGGASTASDNSRSGDSLDLGAARAAAGSRRPTGEGGRRRRQSSGSSGGDSASGSSRSAGATRRRRDERESRSGERGRRGGSPTASTASARSSSSGGTGRTAEERPGRRTTAQSSSSSAAAKARKIETDLKVTKDYLRDANGLLRKYRDMKQARGSAIDKLRADVVGLETELHEERQVLHSRPSEADISRRSAPGLRVEDLGQFTGNRTMSRHRSTSPLKDYRRKDRAYSGDVGSTSVRLDSGRGVLKLSWEDDDGGGGGDAESHMLHELHQSVRDLTSEQRRIGAELASERDERRMLDVQHRRSLTDLTSSLRSHAGWENSSLARPPRREPTAATAASSLSSESSLARQLKSLTEALKSQQESNTKLSTNISQAVSQISQPTTAGGQVLQQPPPTSTRFSSVALSTPYGAAAHPLASAATVAGTMGAIPHGYGSTFTLPSGAAATLMTPATVAQPPAAAAVSGTAAARSGDDSEVALRRQLMEAEAQRRQMQLQLENLQEKYDEAEGSRRSLLNQVEESKSRIQQVEEERFKLKLLVDQYKAEAEREQRRSEEELDDKARALQRLAVELGNARDELGRSVPAREVEDARRELQKAERRQARLTEQIEILTKQVKDKETQCVAYQSDLKQMAVAKSASDAERLQMQNRIESITCRLRDAEARVDGFSSDLAQSESLLQDSERKRQEVKDKAHQAVKLWKDKCRLLEEASARQRDEASKARHECDVALGERDAAREQLATGARQLDAMSDELARLASARAQQDEQLQRLEATVSELRSLRADLEHRTQDLQFQVEQGKLELQSLHGQLASLRAEKSRLDSLLDDADQQQSLLKEKSREFKAEAEELRAENGALARRLAEESKQCTALSKRLDASEQGLAAGRRDLENAQSQLVQLQAEHSRAMDDHQRAVTALNAKLEAATKEAAEAKSRESKTQVDSSRKLKQLILEKDAELQAIKIDLTDTQSSLKLSRKQEEARTQELREASAKLNSAELKAEELSNKCQQLRSALAEAGDEELKRARWAEEEVMAARSAASSKVDQCSAEMRCLHMELKLLVTAAADFSDMRPPPSASSAVSMQLDVDETARDSQALIAWLRQFVNERRDTETRLRSGLRDAAVKEAVEHDWHRSTIAQLQRQKRDVEREAQVKESEVRELEDKVAELNLSLEQQEQRQARLAAYPAAASASWASSEGTAYFTPSDISKETSDVERQRILQQYSSLQSKFSSLKDELSSTPRASRKSSPSRASLSETSDHLAASLPTTAYGHSSSNCYSSTPERPLPTRDSNRVSSGQKYVRIREAPIAFTSSQPRATFDDLDEPSLTYRSSSSPLGSRKPNSILKTGSSCRNLSSTR